MPVTINWFGVLLLTAFLFAAAESGLRVSGRHAEFHDTMQLWAANRAAVDRAGSRAIALLGTSRMQMSIPPKTLEAHFPGKHAYMLANVGKSPMGLLEQLSNDPDFTGTVICGISMHWILPELWDDYDEYNAYYENVWPREQWMSRTRSAFQRSIVLSHGNSFASVVSRLEGKPAVDYLELQEDRYKRGYFEKLGDEIQTHQFRFLNAEYGYYGNSPVPTPADLEPTFERTQAAVVRLQERGCRVIFVRLPTSGGLWEFQQDVYNKTKYWDHFAAMTTAETYHFKDYPELSGFECPDWSHLNYEDAVKFTDALGAILSSSASAPAP